jgi:hypothetical protein
MTEPQIVLWFTAHPFTRNLCLAILTGITAKAHSDYEHLKQFQQGDPTATWSWTVALRQYGMGVILGAGPILSAEVLHLLSTS